MVQFSGGAVFSMIVPQGHVKGLGAQGGAQVRAGRTFAWQKGTEEPAQPNRG
jgi:hypothetical protein